MEQSELKHTPIYEEHVRAKARMIPFTGYSMPVQYTGLVDEHHLVRKAAGLFDVSHMGELVVKGPGALAAVDGLVTNDVQGLVDGQARYTVCCNAGGTVLDDLIIYRRSVDDVLIVCNASNREKIVGHFTGQLKATHEVRDISDETGLIALQGPRAMEILRTAVGDGRADALGMFHFADLPVFGVPCTVSRTGYTGEDGVEIFCPTGEAARIWRDLLTAGEAAGLRPAGLGARNTLRLECRMALYGNDIDETTNPLEAGLAWVVKLEKPFIGRDALVAVKEAGLTRKLVGFEMADKAIARDHWQVINEADEVVGIVTSGSPGPTVGKNIGLAYVPVASSALGTAIRLRDPERGRIGHAVVVKTPFYKRAR